MGARGDFQSRWLPAIAWASGIFALSGMPSLGTGLGLWDEVLRTLAHFGVYAVLAVLLLRALPPVAAALAAVAYAVTDELHQSLVPGRAATLGDLAIDAAGVAVGLLAWHRLDRRPW